MDALTCGIFLAIFVLLSVFGSKMVEKWSVKKINGKMIIITMKSIWNV